MTDTITKPVIKRTNCPICNHTPGMKRSKHKAFWNHILTVHSMTPEQFKEQYPKVYETASKIEDPFNQTQSETAQAPSKTQTRITKTPMIDMDTVVLTVPSEPEVKSLEPTERVKRPYHRRDAVNPEQKDRTLKSVIKTLEGEKPRLNRLGRRATRIMERAISQFQKDLQPH